MKQNPINIKTTKILIKNKDFLKNTITETQNNNKNYKKSPNQSPINKMIKTSLSTKGNLFLTNVKNNNSIYTLNNTNYNTIKNNKYSKKGNLPYVSNNDFHLDDSFTKTKIGKKYSSSNRSLKNKKTIAKKESSLNKEEFPKITNYMIKNLKRENNNIKNNIYKGIERFNIMEWYMKTRFKYAQYKYGISEIQKYFMDLKAYGKPEEEEIEKRKTFYEHVEDIINDIHITQEKKEIEKLNKKYGVEHDKKKIGKSKDDNNENENPQKYQRNEISKALQEINKRKKKEKYKRQEIDEILFKCKHRLHSINCFEKKLPKKEKLTISKKD